ncbi:GM17548 [Drosophila sechellia]|uniref:GM17548 n=1 Tax=Drosophila sechellia TaxID=7238 RepID=B4IGE0_DROSE|nr:GM17548 [Drosophila sechellia]
MFTLVKSPRRSHSKITTQVGVQGKALNFDKDPQLRLAKNDTWHRGTAMKMTVMLVMMGRRTCPMWQGCSQRFDAKISM